jgi:glycosyltransferase involved in cell wall biosynthesis
MVAHGQILWSPANTGPLKIKDQVLTLHDIGPLEHPEWYQLAFSSWYRLFLPLLVRRVTRVVTSSEFVRAKLLERFGLPGECVAVVPGGVDHRIFHQRAILRMEIPQRYALFVGSVQPRKNLPRLLEAWALLGDALPDTWLLIAGTGGSVYRSTSLSTPERVRFLGVVPDADLPGLYAGASVFILPSLDEGFGLPVLEAMASGTVVLASRAGALPEVVGDCGLFFDPMDVTEIADALHRGLRESALRESLREKGLARARQFSWDVSSAMLWSIFEQCQ